MAIDMPDSLCLRPRQEPRGSYLKPPAIEAGGGWVRRGGAFSRASGPIWVAWPRPAVGGLQPSNDALVTLAPASGLGHTQQNNHQQQPLMRTASPPLATGILSLIIVVDYVSPSTQRHNVTQTRPTSILSPPLQIFSCQSVWHEDGFKGLL